MINEPKTKSTLCSVDKDFSLNDSVECTGLARQEMALVRNWHAVLEKIPTGFSPALTLYEHYISISLSDTDEITIEKRPPHCNRGRYLVKVYNQSPVTQFFIDDYDEFPRYYFGEEAMMSEIHAWIKAHKK